MSSLRSRIWAKLGVLVCLVAGSAQAAQYSVELSAQNEQDLLTLFENGEIDDDEYAELLELLQTGVDLNTATRDEIYALPNLTYADVDAILEYRSLKGRIETPGELVTAGVLSADQLQQIGAFLVGGTGLVNEERSASEVYSGWLRLRSLYTLNDALAPPFLFTARVRAYDDYTGFIATTGVRRELNGLAWDSARQGLAAAVPTYRATIPKFFIAWKKERMSLLAGTYRVGYGERLTLANTLRASSNGIYGDQQFNVSSNLTRACNLSNASGVTEPCGDAGSRYLTDDFEWTEGFRGVAGSAVLPLGTQTSLDVQAFGSYQSRSIYQYDVFSRRDCADPRDPACRAPRLYARIEDLSLARPGQSYVSLPDAFTEAFGGAHVALNLSDRLTFGLTGYHSRIAWRPEPAQLDFQESATYPWNGPFGAVGADVQLNVDDFDFGLEATRSYDSMPGAGGGFAFVQRSTYSPRKQELELIFRYYDKGFANPYARPISQADVYEGNRARNEAGARLSYRRQFGRDWRVRGMADFWALPHDDDGVGNSAGTSNLELEARADYSGLRFLKLAAWGAWKDRNLGGASFVCFDEALTASTGRDNFCIGKRMEVDGMVRVEPFSKPWIEPFVRYQHIWAEDPFYQQEARLRQDRGIWMGATSRPLDGLSLRAQFRYRNEDLHSRTHGEDFTWGQLEGRVTLPGQTGLMLRYDRFEFTDERKSTLARQPSPEHRFQLQFEAAI